MSAPRHLNTSVCPYSFNQHVALTDVETGGVGIITDLRSYLVTGLGWTEPSTNLFKSPTDALGHWFDVLCTRISATNIEFRVRDQFTHTIITRRIQIDGAGTTINFYAGKFYIIVESLRATAELFQAMLSETSPDLTQNLNYQPFGAVFATAYRTAADANDNNGDDIGDLFNFEWNASVARRRIFTSSAIADLTVYSRIFTSGSNIIEEAGLSTTQNAASDHMGMGRRWQTFLVPSSITFNSDKALEVDDNVTATFRCLSLTTLGLGRLMVRKSDP